jgi:hypothetical protein
MMDETPHTETDTFLLILSDLDIVRVGALLGLRARPAHRHDVKLVDSFIQSDVPFTESHQSWLITTLPNVPSQ